LVFGTDSEPQRGKHGQGKEEQIWASEPG